MGTEYAGDCHSQGRIYPQGGLFRKKTWGPFTSKKTGDLFLVIAVPGSVRPRVSDVSSPEKLATFLCSLLSLFTRGLPIFSVFRHAKNSPLLLWGPVRPNVLNMPKSAAGHGRCYGGNVEFCVTAARSCLVTRTAAIALAG